MHLTDKIFDGKLRGHPRIEILDAKTGEVLDSWEDDNIITYQSKQALVGAVSAPTVNTTVSSINLGTDLGEVVQGSPNISFTNPGTITRATGSWVTDGFTGGDYITISGSTGGLNDTSNIGLPVLQIASLTPTVITLATGTVTINGTSYTLGTVVTQTSASGIKVSRGNVLSPSAPLATYDQTTMPAMGTILFAAPYALLVGNINSTTVSFNVTIIGSDVMALYPGHTSETFTSAALLTGNGNVFAYARFPQKSISAVVNIGITWQVGY